MELSPETRKGSWSLLTAAFRTLATREVIASSDMSTRFDKVDTATQDILLLLQTLQQESLCNIVRLSHEGEFTVCVLNL